LRVEGSTSPQWYYFQFQNYVIQYDFPTKPKIFIHRSGRTARAGLSGKTISILATNETMYAIDLLLYIGRKLTNENDFTDYADKVNLITLGFLRIDSI
jgi:superfamily II DNA/RNA helicase